ncbi:MAG: glycoside hydrolase family 3 C-terminal domain-containing protein [Mediterranea sp.]|jgi:beta-glucosidase|nr:glycoside hydrolase family 3 C-terminal domain-containing protein [Mediterranea sp.]
MKFLKYLLLLILVGFVPSCFAQNYPFRNTKLPTEQRIQDLISRLTLEEKVSQMINSTSGVERLDIPPYDWWNECLHGVGRAEEYKVTVFPQAIGMAATWDDAGLRQIGATIAEEGRAIYNDAQSKKNYARYHALTYWTPNINIFRDPRWGRGQETYGEDPYLTGTLGKAFVHGLQGDDAKYLKASACAKHYAVHSGPEKLRHVFNAEVSARDLWDTYLPAFRDLVVDAKVSGVMCAYNAFYEQPCCGSNTLMQYILRDKWDFTGYVTSDCGAIDDFFHTHKTYSNAASAAADALFHGTDVDCGRAAYSALVDAVKKGIIAEEQINVSLARLFNIRFRLGLFDPAEEVSFSKIPLSVLECDAHKALSHKIAQESVVLLKNKSNFLPLSKKLKKIAVIGPNADNEHSVLGNYNGFPTEIVTPLEAIKSRVSPSTKVIYEKAVDYVAEPNEAEVAALINRLKGVDVVVMVGGITPALEGEEMPVTVEGFSGGDKTSINLPRVQTHLMQALTKAGIPTVFVMMTGSAIAIPWEEANLPAILNAWYGGQDAGTAIADVLFGDYNPSGKLPVTFYANDNDLPPFESYSMEGRTYRYFKGTALYPFGYGLSYTRFKYSPLKIQKNGKTGETIVVEAEVKNVGKIAGDEVVQLYVSHPNTEVLSAIYALKSFKRITLKAGETQKISFTLTPKELGIVNEVGELTVYPGDVKIYVGGTSPAASVATALPVVEATVNIQGDLVVIK